MGAKAAFALTAKGRAQLDGVTGLSPEELKLLVLVDGALALEELHRQCRPLDSATVDGMLLRLAQAGYIGAAADAATRGYDVLDMALGEESDAGIASLRQQGFFVRIARHAPGARQAAAGESLTVLVVEDDQQLAKLLDLYMRMENMKTRRAANRAEIVAAMNQKPPPDLVLLDLTLPDVDGFDVLSRIRQHDALRKTPVILCTARATREAVLEGLRRGADGYVTKPFNAEALQRAVKTVLGLP